MLSGLQPSVQVVVRQQWIWGERRDLPIDHHGVRQGIDPCHGRVDTVALGPVEIEPVIVKEEARGVEILPGRTLEFLDVSLALRT